MNPIWRSAYPNAASNKNRLCTADQETLHPVTRSLGRFDIFCCTGYCGQCGGKFNTAEKAFAQSGIFLGALPWPRLGVSLIKFFPFFQQVFLHSPRSQPSLWSFRFPPFRLSRLPQPRLGVSLISFFFPFSNFSYTRRDHS